MSISATVERIRVIVARDWATVWLVRFQGAEAVLKQYRAENAEAYEREIKNVTHIGRAGFTDMPAMLGHDDSERAILYEYVPDGDVWTRLLFCRGAQRGDLIERTLDTMERECAMLEDPVLHDLAPLGRDPYVRIRRLAERADQGDERFAFTRTLARKADCLPGPFLCTRYDPELTNYLLAPDGRILASDFAGVRCCHALYLPAYALIHSAIAWRRTRNPEARAVMGAFTHAVRARFVTDHTRRCLWLLNLAEVFAYFVEWALRKAKLIDPWHLRGMLVTGRKVIALANR